MDEVFDYSKCKGENCNNSCSEFYFFQSARYQEMQDQCSAIDKDRAQTRLAICRERGCIRLAEIVVIEGDFRYNKPKQT